MRRFWHGARAVILVLVSYITPSRLTLLILGLGMKTAKLEIKMIVALVLCRYDYKLVDGSGKPVKQAPQLNRNDNQQVWQFR